MYKTGMNCLHEAYKQEKLMEMWDVYYGRFPWFTFLLYTVPVSLAILGVLIALR